MAARWVKAVIGLLVDPPNWLPPWALTTVFLVLCWRGANSPEKSLEAARIIKDYGVPTLAIWLGYKGIGIGFSVVANWLGVKGHAPQTESRAVSDAGAGSPGPRTETGPLA